jgi:hypothetical protein
LPIPDLLLKATGFCHSCKELVWKDKGIFIITFPLIYPRWPRQCVGLIQLAWVVHQLVIVVCKVTKIPCHASVDSLRLPVVLEIIVISVDNGSKGGGEEQVSPLSQTLNYCQKFSIMDIIPFLSLVQCLRVVAHWAESLFVVSLIEDGSSGILRHVHLHLKGMIVVRSLEDRVSLYDLEKCVQSLGALICPSEWSSLLQQGSEWCCKVCKVGNKWSLVSQNTERAPNLLY